MPKSTSGWIAAVLLPACIVAGVVWAAKHPETAAEAAVNYDSPSTSTPSATKTSSSQTRKPATTTPQPSPKTVVGPLPKMPKDACIRDYCRKQMVNAQWIVRAGLDMKIPHRGLVIAIATAIQESDLYNSASTAVPKSLKYPHDGISVDHLSVGLFQQQPWWGPLSDLMNPYKSSVIFYRALKDTINGKHWQNIWEDPNKLALWRIAYEVQNCAERYATYYQKHESAAIAIVNYVLQHELPKA